MDGGCLKFANLPSCCGGFFVPLATMKVFCLGERDVMKKIWEWLLRLPFLRVQMVSGLMFLSVGIWVVEEVKTCVSKEGYVG